MLYGVLSPDSLTTRAHLDLATHMKAGWVKDLQMVPTTLKLMYH